MGCTAYSSTGLCLSFTSEKSCPTMLLTNSGARPIALSLQITWATTRPRPDASPEAPYSERRRLRTYFTHVLLHRRFRPGFNKKDNQILQYKASSTSRKSAPSSRFQPATKVPLRHATFRPRATAAFLVHIARFSRGHHHHQCPRPLTSILISASTASTHSLDNATTQQRTPCCSMSSHSTVIAVCARI